MESPTGEDEDEFGTGPYHPIAKHKSDGTQDAVRAEEGYVEVNRDSAERDVIPYKPIRLETFSQNELRVMLAGMYAGIVVQLILLITSTSDLHSDSTSIIIQWVVGGLLLVVAIWFTSATFESQIKRFFRFICGRRSSESRGQQDLEKKSLSEISGDRFANTERNDENSRWPVASDLDGAVPGALEGNSNDKTVKLIDPPRKTKKRWKHFSQLFPVAAHQSVYGSLSHLQSILSMKKHTVMPNAASTDDDRKASARGNSMGVALSDGSTVQIPKIDAKSGDEEPAVEQIITTQVERSKIENLPSDHKLYSPSDIEDSPSQGSPKPYHQGKVEDEDVLALLSDTKFEKRYREEKIAELDVLQGDAAEEGFASSPMTSGRSAFEEIAVVADGSVDADSMTEPKSRHAVDRDSLLGLFKFWDLTGVDEGLTDDESLYSPTEKGVFPQQCIVLGILWVNVVIFVINVNLMAFLDLEDKDILSVSVMTQVLITLCLALLLVVSFRQNVFQWQIIIKYGVWTAVLFALFSIVMVLDKKEVWSNGTTVGLNILISGLGSVALLRDVAITGRHLGRLPYITTRPYQLGFRLFVFQGFIIILVLSIVTHSVALANGDPSMNPAIRVWMIVVAFSFTPATARGLRKAQEQGSSHGGDEKINLYDCILAFYCSHASYYDPPGQVTGSAKGDLATDCPLPPDLILIEFIHEPLLDAQCMVLYSIANRCVIVAYRGTSSSKNAKTDLKASKVPLKTEQTHIIYNLEISPVRVHSGFYEVHCLMRNRVIQRVKQVCEDKVKYSVQWILMTGHSLGGALAMLSSLDIKAYIPQYELHLYTFGSPRVGNIWFRDFLQSHIPNSFRIVYERDPIPAVPKGFGYCHAGNEALIDRFGNLIYRPSAVERRLLRQLGGRRLDHKRYAYAEGLHCLYSRIGPTSTMDGLLVEDLLASADVHLAEFYHFNKKANRSGSQRCSTQRDPSSVV